MKSSRENVMLDEVAYSTLTFSGTTNSILPWRAQSKAKYFETIFRLADSCDPFSFMEIIDNTKNMTLN